MNPVTIHLSPARVRDRQHRRAVTAPVDVGTLRERYRYARREGVSAYIARHYAIGVAVSVETIVRPVTVERQR